MMVGDPYDILMRPFVLMVLWGNSLQDYADFLEGSYYVGVHRSNTKNYKDATAALTGVYATDRTQRRQIKQHH